MARAVISDPKRRTAREPLYDIDTLSGASVEIFYAYGALAEFFGTSPGWFWWSVYQGAREQRRRNDDKDDRQQRSVLHVG